MFVSERISILDGPTASSFLDGEFRALSEVVVSLKQDFAKHIRSANAQFLSIKDQVTSLRHRVDDKLSKDMGLVLDNLNVLQQQVEDLSCLKIPSNSSSQERLPPSRVNNRNRNNNRNRLHSDRLPLNPASQSGFPADNFISGSSQARSCHAHLSVEEPYRLVRLRGIDPSNSPLVIGRLIEGLYSYENVPDFSVSYGHSDGSFPAPVFDISIHVKDLRLFHQLWNSPGVRHDLGFLLLDTPSPSIQVVPLPPLSSVPEDLVLHDLPSTLTPSASLVLEGPVTGDRPVPSHPARSLSGHVSSSTKASSQPCLSSEPVLCTSSGLENVGGLHTSVNSLSINDSYGLSPFNSASSFLVMPPTPNHPRPSSHTPRCGPLSN